MKSYKSVGVFSNILCNNIFNMYCTSTNNIFKPNDILTDTESGET